MTPGGARGHGLRVHDGLVSTHLALALAALAATMACAVLRPRGIPEAAVAVAGAALVVVTGGLGPSAALDEARDLGPTLAFLAAILVMGAMAERDGLFRAAGGLLARRAGRSPTRLLGLVVVVASLVTAVLSLDATVVLLTPVVVATTAALAMAPRPHTHACVHLANSASLLLPVSNLSNLLALRASGLSFPRFAALMALPWMAAIAVEWVGLRRLFARDLAAPAGDAPAGDGARAPVPRFALLVIALTLAGFLVEGPLGIDPAVVAAAGALALAVPALRRGRARPTDVVRAAAPSLLLFVLGLGIVVRAAGAAGLDDAVAAVVPSGDSLAALVGIAAAAALLANLVNNLPAILILLPALAGQGPGPVLAALIGVNVGANLTYVGSLATLLWRRVLDGGPGGATDLAVFTRLGVATVLPGVLLATLALWASLRLWGP